MGFSVSFIPNAYVLGRMNETNISHTPVVYWERSVSFLYALATLTSLVIMYQMI